jgi:hypothetical protein
MTFVENRLQFGDRLPVLRAAGGTLQLNQPIQRHAATGDFKGIQLDREW